MKRIALLTIVMMIIVTTAIASAGDLAIPADITVEATGNPTHVPDLGTPTGGVPPYTTSNDAPPGNNFPVGKTFVMWDVSDSAGNTTKGKQTITVQDTVAPNIVISGSNPAKINLGDVYIDAGATATDVVDGTVPVNTIGTVDTSKIGTYTIKYTARDSSNNVAEKTRTVNVVQPIDIVPPVITVLGKKLVTVYVGDIYIDAGATATDNVDGDITAKIVTNNPVNTNIVDIYTVTYDVTDKAGNPAQQKTRIVNVIDYPTPKQLTIVAPQDKTVEATGINTIVKLGNASISGGTQPVSIDNDAPAGGFPIGTTTVTWTATDSVGSVAKDVQLITITDTTAPKMPTLTDVKKAATGINTTVNLVPPTATDLVDPSPTVTNNAPAGNNFPLGNTVVTWTACDHALPTPNCGTTIQHVIVEGKLEISADTKSVNINESKNVTFKVSRKCGIETGDNCTLSNNVYMTGAGVALTGIFTGSCTTDDVGQCSVIINATTNGTIIATASKSGYMDNSVNITAGIAPTPSPTSPPSGGGGGGGGGNSGGSSGGNSGGSSGGGGGGTAEPYENVYKYEIQEHNVFTTPVSFRYNTPELVVYEVMVTSNQSNIASLRIEVLKDTSKLVGRPAPGIVYKNINAWIDYKRIKNATIRFKVENSWLGSNGLLPGDVKMSKWDNNSRDWTELLTNILNKDDKYTYLESQTDNIFGSFAINGIKYENSPSDVESPIITIQTPIEEVSQTENKPVETMPPKSPGFEIVSTIYILSMVYLIMRIKR